jgi:hypothetical protein
MRDFPSGLKSLRENPKNRPSAARGKHVLYAVASVGGLEQENSGASEAELPGCLIPA